VRGSDLVARYGGEEFAVILPETTMPEATDAAERVRLGVGASTITFGSGEIHVTVSIGLAGLPMVSIDSAARLIESADHALYRAKSQGRNRVVCYEPAGDQNSQAAPQPEIADIDGQRPNPVS
jgi:diguanylate cyclase (GGDEF)-like protein